MTATLLILFLSYVTYFFFFLSCLFAMGTDGPGLMTPTSLRTRRPAIYSDLSELLPTYYGYHARHTYLHGRFLLF